VIRVLDPTKKQKLVVPSDPTDPHSNDKLERNVIKIATSKPMKKKKKPKSDPNKIHASKQAIKQSKRGTLVDRGANGGMLGNDAKVIFKRSKTVDVTGIDNHEITALPIIDATAKTITDKGPAGVKIDNPTGPPNEDPDNIKVNFHVADATMQVHQACRGVSHLSKAFVYEDEGMPDDEVETVEEEDETEEDIEANIPPVETLSKPVDYSKHWLHFPF